MRFMSNVNRIVLHYGRVSTARPGSVNGNEQPLKEGSLGKLEHQIEEPLQ